MGSFRIETEGEGLADQAYHHANDHHLHLHQHPPQRCAPPLDQDSVLDTAIMVLSPETDFSGGQLSDGPKKSFLIARDSADKDDICYASYRDCPAQGTGTNTVMESLGGNFVGSSYDQQKESADRRELKRSEFNSGSPGLPVPCQHQPGMQP